MQINKLERKLKFIDLISRRKHFGFVINRIPADKEDKQLKLLVNRSYLNFYTLMPKNSSTVLSMSHFKPLCESV